MKSISVTMLVLFLLCASWMESSSAEDEPRATPKKEKLAKIVNAIKSTLENPSSARDTTSEISKTIQSLGDIKSEDIKTKPELYNILKDLFLKIVENPKLDDYFAIFSSRFQTRLLPTAIQDEDLNSPLLKSKLVTSFPKQVEDSAQLENKEVTINGTFVDDCPFAIPWNGKCPYKYKKGNWISTNLYAKQGQLVTVTVPEDLVGKFAIRVNAHTDDVHVKYMKSWIKGKTFKRPSSITQHYKNQIIKQKTRLLTPYGGLIFIDIGKPPINLGKFTLKFENVITSPKFKQGETTSEEWSKALASSKSPMVELEVPGLRIIIPRSFVDKRNLDIPRVARTATAMMNAIHKMQGYVMPRPHLYVYDVALTIGGAHSGYPITDRDYIGEMKQMENENPSRVRAMPHEIGHVLEWPAYTPKGLTDVINNLFVLYANEVAFKSNPNPDLKCADNFKKGDRKFSILTIVDKLNIFKIIQQECTWQTYIDFFKYYNEEIPRELKPKNTDEGYSLITRVLSEKCNKNMIPFFKWWNWPVLNDAVEATKDLPKWEGIIDTLENAKKPNDDLYTIHVNKGNLIKEPLKELNTDTYGFDMESKEVNGENECANWCGTTGGCTFWTWRKRDNFCWIKNGDIYTIKRSGFTSGSKRVASKAIQLPRDGNWNLLFRQTINGKDDLFKKNEWSRNKENVDAPNFSRLEDFEKFRRPDGTFHLFLWYPELGEGNEWTQTSNPVTKTSKGVYNYKAISISYSGGDWGGLEYNNGPALLDGSIKRKSWFYAIGATRTSPSYKQTIPGPADDNGNILVKNVELYIDYQVVDTVIPETRRKCPDLYTCESKETCPYIQNKFEEIRQARADQQSQLINFLKSIVCNKERKAFCCQKSD